MSIEFSHNGQRVSRDPIQVGAESTTILAFNVHRRYANIYNNSSKDIVWISFNIPAEEFKCVPILPRTSYVIDYSNLTPADINAITGTGGSAIVSVTECV